MDEQARQRDDYQSFADALARRAAERPEHIAFIFLNNRSEPAEELSYRELDDRARALASELLARDLGGKRIILLFPSGFEFVIALFASFYAGALAVPVPYTAGKRTADRLRSICRDAKPAAVLTLSTLPAARELQ